MAINVLEDRLSDNKAKVLKSGAVKTGNDASKRFPSNLIVAIFSTFFKLLATR